MAKFLTTHGIAHHIEQLLLTSERELTLISPYLQISEAFLTRLKDADRRGLPIRFVYRAQHDAPGGTEKLSELSNVLLYSLPNLHAKCYANESQAVLGSMNFYEHSEKKNREMGVLLTAADDPEAFTAAVKEIGSILGAATPVKNAPRVKEGRARRDPARTPRLLGTCIRCAARILANADAPFCRECYAVWVTFANEDYKEVYCHTCGKAHATSMARPLCYDCYRKTPFAKRSL